MNSSVVRSCWTLVLVSLGWSFPSCLRAGDFENFGPLERTSRPVVLVYRAVNAKTYEDSASVVGLGMQAVSDSMMRSKSGKLLAAVQAAVPDLDIEAEMQVALRCGEAGSICSEFRSIALTDQENIQERLHDLMKSEGWERFSLLSLWFDSQGVNILTRAAIEDVETGPAGRLILSQPTRVSYLSVLPDEAKRKGRQERGAAPSIPGIADGWRIGSPSLLEGSLRASMLELEPLFQLALSAAANNDAKVFEPYERSLRDWKSLRSDGVKCPGVIVCLWSVAALKESRVWWWNPVASRGAMTGSQEMINKHGLIIMELQSSPRVAIDDDDRAR